MISVYFYIFSIPIYWTLHILRRLPELQHFSSYFEVLKFMNFWYKVTRVGNVGLILSGEMSFWAEQGRRGVAVVINQLWSKSILDKI